MNLTTTTTQESFAKFHEQISHQRDGRYYLDQHTFGLNLRPQRKKKQFEIRKFETLD